MYRSKTSLSSSRAAVLAAAFGLAAGCGGGGGETKAELEGVDDGVRDPDRFLEYFDPQAGLAGGEYTVRAERSGTDGAASFELTIEQSDGPVEVFDGTWTDGESTATRSFRLEEAGGARIALESNAAERVVLGHGTLGTTLGSVQAGGDGRATLQRPDSEINSRAYAEAYYDAVDPLDERTTLAGWKEASGFNDCAGEVVEVRFRDTKDLGYGRHMRVCTRTPDGGMAAFVDNYQVDPLPSIGYSPLNLDAVLERNGDWTIGTNAIEFTRPQAADGTVLSNEPHVAKFFTYTPWSDPGPQRLRLLADLDGRGKKAMPMICVQCHGGTLQPLEPDGSFPLLRTPSNPGVPGGTEAKMQALEVDTFTFPDSGRFSRANQEEKIRKINAAVYRSYNTGDYGGAGEWDATFLKELLDGWYGGDVTQQGATFDYDYVPSGWRPDPSDGSPPEGADRLFREVVAPRCIVCHGKRGTNLQDDISFSTYQQFIGHADQLERLTYDEALMPAGLVEFNQFWADLGPNGEPAILGSFLPGFSSGNPDGSVDKPGSPVANAGPDRTVGGLPVTLSAEDSAFADAYEWELVSAPSGAGAALANAMSARATLSGDVDGDYVVRLTATKGDESTTDTATITVNGSLTLGGLNVPAPREIRLRDGDAGTADVRWVLQNSLGTQACADCHSQGNAGSIAGVPMYWTDDGTGDDIDRLYRDARARVNLRDPLASRILRKPSGKHHNGGQRPGFDTDGDPGDHLAYDLFYTWIVEGAPR